MRFLLSTVLLVAATALACHGFFHEAEARTAYEVLSSRRSPTVAAAAHEGPRTLAQLVETWPYTTAASDARADILSAWIDERPEPAPTNVVTDAWANVTQNGFRDTLPFALPAGVAAVALGALVLAILMPRTRFRDFGITFLVLGGLACWPGLVPPRHQVTYVGWFDPVRHAIAWLPQIAVGLLFISGLVMAGCRRAKPSED